MQQMAARRGVPLRLHTVIYKLMDQLKDELSSKLPPLSSQNVLGKLGSFGPAQTCSGDLRRRLFWSR